MGKKSDLKVLRVCAGVLFLLLPAAVLWRCIGGPAFTSGIDWSEMLDILLRGAAFLTLAVGCFCGKELVLAIGAGLWCLPAMANMATSLFLGFLGPWGQIFNAAIALVELLAAVLLLFLVVTRLVPRLRRVGKWLWVLPALLLLADVGLPFLYDVVCCVELIGSYDFLPVVLRQTLLLATPADLLTFTAGLLLCLWCAFAPVRERAKKAAVPPAAPAQDLSRLGQQAEMLKQYKDLLDSGAISQEEFDRKKAQILGQ